MTNTLETVGVTRRLLGRTRGRVPGLLVAGLVGLVITLVFTFFGEAISGFEAGKQSLGDRLQPPLREGHWLGTDRLGRDMLATVTEGFAWSLPVGLIATSIAATLGTLIGVAAGWSEGWIRSILSRFMEMAISFPYLVLAVAVISVTGHGFWSLTLVLGLVSWISFARVIFVETQAIKKREYVVAARLMGLRPSRIIATYVLRGLRHTIAVMFAFIFADLLVAEAGLSFLGVGAPIGEPSWGIMLSASREHLFTAPWLMYAPAGAVVLTVLTANLLGDGLIQLWSKGTAQQ